MEDKFKFLKSKPLQAEKGVKFLDDEKDSNTERQEEIENNSTYTDGKYIKRYFDTINNPYTVYKNEIIADTIKSLHCKNILDVGGNINNVAIGGVPDKIGDENMDSYTVVDLDKNTGDSEFISNIAPANSFYNKENPKRKFIHDDILTFSPEQKYDCVILADVLEHITNPIDALSKISTLLDDNGKAILVVPSLYKADIFDKKEIKSKLKSSHVNFFDRELMEALIQDNFNTLEVKGIQYSTGFTYLLYLDTKFIPVKKEDGMERGHTTTSERVVKRLIELVSIFDSKAIDEYLNNSENYSNFIKEIEHPLDTIYKCLEFDKEYNSPEKGHIYKTIKRIVTSYKEIYTGDVNKTMDILKKNTFCANSIMYLLTKKDI